ncbi:MAG TPA: zf-HC2 domain-containing protein [bacterium]|nr:zf-HC2 domain-containing protein [bacterium]
MGEKVDICCQETKKLIIAHLAGALGREGRTKLLMHMRSCPHCWQLVGNIARGAEQPYTRVPTFTQRVVHV